MPSRPERVFEASPELDARLLPELRALPYFREATREEIDASFAAYERVVDTGGREGVTQLCEVWAAVAEPTRATLPRALRFAYAHAGKGPRQVNATVFLESLRAALRAGERFRERLSPAVQAVLRSEFPYLERRHEHVPPGEVEGFEFPDVFARYLEPGELGGLDDTRARWQLAVSVNEVQQCCYSEFAAAHFGLPQLRRHAARERALAHNYFAHWSPRCTLDLWRETIYVLDALNAATFELVCATLLPRAMAPARVFDRRARQEDWRVFVEGLDTPQWLLEPPRAVERGDVG